MPPATPKFIAHRFGREYGPDSTAATLAHALTGPIDGLETDCCLTADGRLALLHINYLPMGITLDGFAHERTAAEITAAHVLDQQGRVTDHHPLLLEDLWPLVAGHELVVQLEVKAILDGALADRTAHAINEALVATPPPPGITIEVISFWPECLPIAAAAGHATRPIIATPYTPADLARWSLDHGITGVLLEAPFWSAHHVDIWRQAGLSLMSGVCNLADLARAVSLFGPDAFATDRPHELQAELGLHPA